VSAQRIYVEGAGGNKIINAACREGFRKLLEKSGFTGRIPRIVACGSRNEAYADFKIAQQKEGDAIILIVDSEEPVSDNNQPWKHLKERDGWECPNGVLDSQVILMTTCMETWIVADRVYLKKRYKNLQESALPSLQNLEKQDRKDILKKLEKATNGTYQKGEHSFRILAEISPEELKKYLPAFERMVRLLEEQW
jgi:Domain of unknown function (DUF4276)